MSNRPVHLTWNILQYFLWTFNIITEETDSHFIKPSTSAGLNSTTNDWFKLCRIRSMLFQLFNAYRNSSNLPHFLTLWFSSQTIASISCPAGRRTELLHQQGRAQLPSSSSCSWWGGHGSSTSSPESSKSLTGRTWWSSARRAWSIVWLVTIASPRQIWVD